MSTENKVQNVADKVKGKTKEAVGKVTGNKSLQAKGKGDQAKATVKQTGEKVKDALHLHRK